MLTLGPSIDTCSIYDKFRLEIDVLKYLKISVSCMTENDEFQNLTFIVLVVLSQNLTSVSIWLSWRSRDFVEEVSVLDALFVFEKMGNFISQMKMFLSPRMTPYSSYTDVG